MTDSVPYAGGSAIRENGSIRKGFQPFIDLPFDGALNEPIKPSVCRKKRYD